MQMIDNPRFPHYCRIIRKTSADPMEDEEDFSPLVAEDAFDPMGTDDMGNSGVDDGNAALDSDDVGANSQSQVIYEGPCRSYAKNTTSDKGEVITSYRGLSLPVTERDWKTLGVVPQEGDELVVDRGAFKEYGRIIDRNPANFHGTHLTWHYGRN